MEHLVTIMFLVPESYKVNDLHEDLCLAIHEGNESAVDRLHDNVTDIVHPNYQKGSDG